jgi:dihydrofolate reductase
MEGLQEFLRQPITTGARSNPQPIKEFSTGLVLLDMAMSLDGFAADERGRSVYPIEELQGTAALRDMIAATGAVVMGRRAYDMAEGDFTKYEYQVPLFVLTHRPPKVVARGENDHLSFTFVTDGIESAISMARAAAGEKRVTVIGGPCTFQQCIAAGLAGELQVRVIPRLLGNGLRLFNEAIIRPRHLVRLSVHELATRTDLTFRPRS